MKAIDLNTHKAVYVMEVRDNSGKIIKYVSDSQSYYPNQLQIIKTEDDYE